MAYEAPTIREDGSRRWIYPDRRSGYYSRLRKHISIFLIIIYVLTPLLSFQGKPLLRFDIMSGQIFCFGNVYRYVDTSYIVFIFLLAALGLFLVTSVKGRLWCGFACPQTVFIDWVVRPIEEWIEGPAHRRRSKDQQPLNSRTFFKKFFKHLLFFGLACALSNILLAYFIDPVVLLGWMASSPTIHFSSFTVMLTISLFLYFDFAWFREQFCSFLCPYARFQSIVMESTTPAVSYDYRRGEPRGKKNQGDCIDCGLCVRVCPTGIDIRQGLQLECIQCYRCVDACNLVMTTLKRPIGLIRNLSLNDLEERRPLNFFTTLLKPKTLLLGAAILFLSSFLVFKIYQRKPMEMVLIRQPGPVFSQLENGNLTNLFTLDLVNTTPQELKLHFSLEPQSLIQLHCGGCSEPLKPYEKRKVALVFEIAGLGIESTLLHHLETGEKIRVPLILPLK